MTSARARIGVAIIAGLLATTTLSTMIRIVHADAAQTAVADQLFDDAKKLMEAGNYKDACPKLAESLRLDPGEGTFLRLAFCYENLGRLATAWTMYRDGLANAKKSGNAKRIAFATKQMAGVGPRLSKVTVVVSTPVDGLEVTWDGKPFVAGSAVPVDGGKHVLAVKAPGKKPYEETIVVATEKDAKTVRVPPLEDAPPTPKTGEVANPRSKVPAIVAFSAAGLFVGSAIVSRVLMGNAKDDYTATCALQRTPGPCTDDADKNRGKTWEVLSFVSAGLGVAALGTGIVLMTTGGSSETKAGLVVSPNVGLANGITVSGAF